VANAIQIEVYTTAAWLNGTTASFTYYVATARMPRLTMKDVSRKSTYDFLYTAPV